MMISAPDYTNIEELPDETFKISISLEEILNNMGMYNYNILTRRYSPIPFEYKTHTIKISNNHLKYNPKLLNKTELPDGSLAFTPNYDRVEEYFEEQGATYLICHPNFTYEETSTLEDAASKYNHRLNFETLKNTRITRIIPNLKPSFPIPYCLPPNNPETLKERLRRTILQKEPTI